LVSSHPPSLPTRWFPESSTTYADARALVRQLEQSHPPRKSTTAVGQNDTCMSSWRIPPWWTDQQQDAGADAEEGSSLWNFAPFVCVAGRENVRKFRASAGRGSWLAAREVSDANTARKDTRAREEPYPPKRPHVLAASRRGSAWLRLGTSVFVSAAARNRSKKDC
jgi:hypothetical protein